MSAQGKMIRSQRTPTCTAGSGALIAWTAPKRGSSRGTFWPCARAPSGTTARTRTPRAATMRATNTSELQWVRRLVIAEADSRGTAVPVFRADLSERMPVCEVARAGSPLPGLSGRRRAGSRSAIAQRVLGDEHLLELIGPFANL